MATDPQNDQNQQQAPATDDKKKKALKYFRTSIAALSVVVGDPKEGQVAPQVVRFKPFLQRWDGEMQRFGYLATDNATALKKLAADPMVEEITAEEYAQVFARAEDPSDLNVNFDRM